MTDDATNPTDGTLKALATILDAMPEEASQSFAGARGSVPEVCKWIETELCAGMVLLPNSKEDRLWNQAHQRAIGIVANYRRGEGLFQMTAPNTRI